MTRPPPPPCPACPTGATACACAAREAALDREAARWASEATGLPVAALGLPTLDSGRLLGGNLERMDRAEPIDQVRALEANRVERAALGLYLEQLEVRARVLGARIKADEAARVELDERLALGRNEAAELAQDLTVLRMFLDGVGLREIAAAFDRQSHSWASTQMSRIREAAFAVEERTSVEVWCARPGCLGLVTRAQPAQGGGRRTRYCHAKCATLDRKRRQRDRERARRTVTRTVTVTVRGRHGRPITVKRAQRLGHGGHGL